MNIVSGRPNDNSNAAFFAALVHGSAQHPCAQLRVNGLLVGQVLADGLQYCTSSMTLNKCHTAWIDILRNKTVWCS